MKILQNKKGHSGNVHMVIGLAVLLVLYLINNKFSIFQLHITPKDITISILITMFYSRLPDQDIEGSKVNDWVSLALVGVIIWAFFTSHILYGLIAALYIAFLQVINHRGVVHSFGMGILMSVPLYFINPLFFIVGLVAYLQHLISEGDFKLWTEDNWRFAV